MENICSPFLFYYICKMEKLYELKLKSYSSLRQRDYNNLSDWYNNDEHFYDSKGKKFTFLSEDNTEEVFVNNYGNLLYQLRMHYAIIVVEKSEKKVSLKVFSGMKRRLAGFRYFKKTTLLQYITLDLEKGDFYLGQITNYHSRKNSTKHLRKNYFVMMPLSNMLDKVKSVLHNFNLLERDKIAHDVIKKFLEPIYQDKSLNHSLHQILGKFHLERKKIKFPNNYNTYLFNLEGKPKKKFLDKCDNKLVEAFMLQNNLTGKKLKRALHECEKLNIALYKSAIKLFGENMLTQDSENIIVDILNFSGVLNENYLEQFKGFASPEEMKRVYKVFKGVFVNQLINSYTFCDHITMYCQLKIYGETELRWLSEDTEKDFHDEHLDWSEKLSYYKRGNYIRIYPEYFKKNIQQPIKDVEGDIFYPILLTLSKDYNGESLVQSNCVKGYIGRAGSYIISLRKGSEDSDVRATIEYRIHYLKNSNEIIAVRIQSLGRFNSGLGDSWKDVLNKLDEKMDILVRDKNFIPVMIRKECMNGIILESTSSWNDSGILKWDMDKTIDLNSYQLYEF